MLSNDTLAIVRALGGSYDARGTYSENTRALIGAIAGVGECGGPISNETMILCKAWRGDYTGADERLSTDGRAILRAIRGDYTPRSTVSNDTRAIIQAMGSYTIDPEPEPEPQSVTNVEKLSLPVATAVGTQVSVSDGFYLTEVTDLEYLEGLWVANGIHESKASYTRPDSPNSYAHWTEGDFTFPAWEIHIAANPGMASYDDVEFPWLVTDWLKVDETTPQPATLTHPALQQLAAASTAQGGVFVAGGTQDGVYPYVIDDARYYLLGDGALSKSIYKEEGVWHIVDTDGAGPVYYSLSDVATPDLASDWKNASDDTPAAITVTSVSEGELVSGNKLGSVVRAVNGSANGRNKYTDVLAVAPDLTWDGTKWTDGTTNGSGNMAFPNIGTADPVAAEENWDEV